MVKVKKERILISPEDIVPSSKDFEVIGTFNPAAVRLPSKEILLYIRVVERLIKTEDENYCYSPRMIGKNSFKFKIDKFKKENIEHYSDSDFIFKDKTKRLTYISHLRRVILSKDGFNVKYIDPKPAFFGTAHDGEFGVEDPRITKIDNLYYMTYVNLSRDENISTSLAVSNDLKNWKRKGIIFGEQDKDVVLFPEKINSKYVVFDRPEGNFQFSPPHIWIAYSKDMMYWGNPDSMKLTKKEEWDSERAGAGPPPIKTKKGWLFLYHGVLSARRKKVLNYIIQRMEIAEFIPEEINKNQYIYCVGAALLDLKNPERIISKSKVPILFPFKKHEISSEDKRVIFPTGLILDENKKDILIFLGAGDKLTTVKKISLNKIFSKLEPV